MVDLDALVIRARTLRHDLHRHPELIYQEERTARVVRDELDRLGIAWQACAGTGTIARLADGARGRHLALRADLDALPLTELTGLPYASEHPGLMHACGHDGHTASLLAAAAWLKANEAALPGAVTLVFQPAEEGGHGALRMVEGGALDGVDEIFGYHNWPPIPFGKAGCVPGTIFAANGEWHATITGRGGHASSPHHCIDPILAGAHFVTLAQQIVSRQIAPQDAAVVSVTCFHGGTADNIIPDSVELVGTVRAATTTLRDELARRVEATLTAACAPSGAVGRFTYRPCYPATVNHAGPAARAQDALRAVLGADGLANDGLPVMAAEDFGYYLTHVPGAFILLGAGRPGAVMEPCHSPRFDYNDDLIPLVVKLWSRLAGLA
ncbi:MAG: amidohydrolase [Planctomycetes bacterium]|nr:amidohydrolase [Planctomycetota bacterium]